MTTLHPWTFLPHSWLLPTGPAEPVLPSWVGRAYPCMDSSAGHIWSPRALCCLSATRPCTAKLPQLLERRHFCKGTQCPVEQNVPLVVPYLAHGQPNISVAALVLRALYGIAMALGPAAAGVSNDPFVVEHTTL